MPTPRPASPSAAPQGPSGSDGVVLPQIPGYRVRKRLGEGGMAAVYLATQVSLDRPVAIKVMEREGLQDEVSKQRFENEARTIAQLSHPCIVAIYEVGRTSDGRMYYIMPFLANGDLGQRDLRNDEPAIIRVLRALLSALDYAHQRGIVHRDVKAANVLYDIADRPLLTDFGIAMSKRDTSRITTAGLAVGSSGYMAPEQARGDVVDGRADLYSVGVLAHELLTGRLPYQAPDALALALLHAQSPIPRLPRHKRHWQFFIDKAMAKSPDQRYRDARAMLEATNRIERRSHRHFLGRLWRGHDSAGAGTKGRHLGLAAVGAVIVLGAGLYAARQHLPWSDGDHALVATDKGPARAAPASTPLETKTTAPAAPPAPAAADTPPAAPATSDSPDSTILTAAREAIRVGNLAPPGDGNASDLARMAWKLSPGSDDSRVLVGSVLKALAEREAQSIVEHHDSRVLDDRIKSMQLADATIGRDAPVWREVRAILSGAIDRRVQAERSITDKLALRRTESLSRQIDLTDVYRHALAANQQATAEAAGAAASASLVASLGSSYVVLPKASAKAPLVAVARLQVTRHEYAEFVNATRRPASACNGAKPAPATGRKTWSDPGFSVTSEQPVVCVSWNDANAYTQWLGARSGVHYRLATAADLQAARSQGGLSAGPADWLLERSIAGRGTAGADGSHGSDDVGFRIVRVIDVRR